MAHAASAPAALVASFSLGRTSVAALDVLMRPLPLGAGRGVANVGDHSRIRPAGPAPVGPRGDGPGALARCSLPLPGRRPLRHRPGRSADHGAGPGLRWRCLRSAWPLAGPSPARHPPPSARVRRRLTRRDPHTSLRVVVPEEVAPRRAGLTVTLESDTHAERQWSLPETAPRLMTPTKTVAVLVGVRHAQCERVPPQ
jgi:hypothetical protein